jgi:hypothetical protein
MDRVRKRVGDKRVLALVKAFLKAGILTEDGTLADTNAGTPQGSILSPLLSNVALSVLDEYIAQGSGGPGARPYERAKRRRQGLPNYRLCRYADDWCLAVSGTKAHAEALREEIAEVLATMGLRLSPEKTLVTHIDEGLVFLGWRIQRHRKRGTGKHYVYVYPAKKALVAVMAKVKTICRRNTNLPLGALLRLLNRVLRGWTAYFKYGCSNATFSYLRSYLWKEILRCQRRKHRRSTWKQLRRRYGIWPADGGCRVVRSGQGERKALLLPGNTHPDAIGRAQHEGKHLIPRDLWSARCPETGTPGAGGGSEKPTGGNTDRALRADLTGLSGLPGEVGGCRWCSPRSVLNAASTTHALDGVAELGLIITPGTSRSILAIYCVVMIGSSISSSTAMKVWVSPASRMACTPCCR